MVGMPSPRKPPPPTPTGGGDSAPTLLATAFARLQVEARAVFGGRRASGDNVGKEQPGVQIVATTEMETPSSSFSPPPAQQQGWAQGGIGLVTNGGQGQAESDYAGPDFDCDMSATDVVPAVAAGEVQKITYNEIALEDAEASYTQVSNQADTFGKVVLGLDVSHFASTTADIPTNYYTPAAAGTAPSPLTATPTPPSASPSTDQEVVRNEITAKGSDVSQADANTDTDIVNGALFELKAAETDASITTTLVTLAGATLSIDIPSYTTAELLTEKVQVLNEVTEEDSDASDASKVIQTNAEDGGLVPTKLEVVLTAPGEHHNGTETAAANLASTSSQNNGA